MCKQEDYFKKCIYMHNKKIYFHVMQAQGGQSRAELWDKGQRSTPDSHLWPKTPVLTCSRPPKQNKSYPDAVYSRKHFSLRNKTFGWISVILPVRISGWEGRKWGHYDRKKKWERKPTFEMYTFPKKKNLEYTVYPNAHWSCQRVKILSVHVALKKTDPSCAVSRKVSIQKGSCIAEAKPSLAVKDEHTLIT